MSHAIYALLGSISSGTMRAEDLIPTFVDCLDSLKDEMSASGDESYKSSVARIDDLLANIEQRQQDEDYYDSEDSSFDLDDLTELLDEFAPPYAYFGSHPGDGADYGFWVLEEVQQDVKDSGGQVVSDLSELPEEYRGEVLIINDHGNCTLGYIDESRQFAEVWAIV